MTHNAPLLPLEPATVRARRDGFTWGVLAGAGAMALLVWLVLVWP